MRLIHTADWHLGQRFFGWDRIDEQRHALIQLKEILRKTEADALLVAGDIFDTVNPSSEAERLYYNFLAEIRQENPSLEVVITAGNHDSPIVSMHQLRYFTNSGSKLLVWYKKLLREYPITLLSFTFLKEKEAQALLVFLFHTYALATFPFSLVRKIKWLNLLTRPIKKR